MHFCSIYCCNLFKLTKCTGLIFPPINRLSCCDLYVSALSTPWLLAYTGCLSAIWLAWWLCTHTFILFLCFMWFRRTHKVASIYACLTNSKERFGYLHLYYVCTFVWFSGFLLRIAKTQGNAECRIYVAIFLVLFESISCHQAVSNFYPRQFHFPQSCCSKF